MTKIILIDMDGVIADYEVGFLQAWRLKYPTLPYISVEERALFYLHEQYPKELSDNIRTILTTPKFFQNLPEIKGAKEALYTMEELGYDIFICTSPINQYENCVSEKYNWVAEHFGFDWTKKIIMTKDKTLIYGDILIDDKPLHTGIRTPSWEHILYDAPYNKKLTERKRLTWENWQEVIL
jgi:5'-nucleotidase